VAKYLFVLDSKIDAPYVLLSTIYSTTDRWDDLFKLGKMMNKGLEKSLGCNWITVE
jgi:hypothetical protein